MKPVFLFSAGPRSGSTLLQRFITSGHQVLMWGEGGGSLNHQMEGLRLLGQTLQSHEQPGGGSGAEHFRRFLSDKGKATQWIANMNPPIRHILDVHRHMFENLYGVPAREHGYERWGIKEVRGTEFTIRMLRILFPDAKFVFLVRSPLACLRSIKQREYHFSDNWGRQVARDPVRYFARNWATLAATYAADESGFKIRYEDLIEKTFSSDRLCEYLEIEALDSRFISQSHADWPARSPHLVLENSEIDSVMPLLRDSMKIWKYD